MLPSLSPIGTPALVSARVARKFTLCARRQLLRQSEPRWTSSRQPSTSTHITPANTSFLGTRSVNASMRSPATAVRRDALVRNPRLRGRRAGLPEHVDRHAAAREPVAADPEPARRQRLHQAIADGHRAVFVKRTVV